MKTAAPKGGDADDARKTTRPHTLTPSAAAAQAATPDLPALRERLLEARRRLVERVAEDYPADRRFPDTAWTKMLADIQIAIAAVDAVVAEGEA